MSGCSAVESSSSLVVLEVGRECVLKGGGSKSYEEYIEVDGSV